MFGGLDANGKRLLDGGFMSLTNALEAKTRSSALESATKIKKIRLVYPVSYSDHAIEAKTPEGAGLLIRAEFVKKA